MKTDQRSYYQITLDCMDLLESWLAGENVKFDTKVLLNELYDRTRRKVPVGAPRNQALTVQYDQAKKLVAGGMQIGTACAQVGITRDQFCRRRRMEQQGKDRKERRIY